MVFSKNDFRALVSDPILSGKKLVQVLNIDVVVIRLRIVLTFYLLSFFRVRAVGSLSVSESFRLVREWPPRAGHSRVGVGSLSRGFSRGGKLFAAAMEERQQFRRDGVHQLRRVEQIKVSVEICTRTEYTCGG